MPASLCQAKKDLVEEMVTGTSKEATLHQKLEQLLRWVGAVW